MVFMKELAMFMLIKKEILQVANVFILNRYFSNIADPAGLFINCTQIMNILKDLSVFPKLEK